MWQWIQATWNTVFSLHRTINPLNLKKTKQNQRKETCVIRISASPCKEKLVINDCMMYGCNQLAWGVWTKHKRRRCIFPNPINLWQAVLLPKALCASFMKIYEEL